MANYFHLTWQYGRWLLVDPADALFWSIGMNHIDSATLRYPDSGDVWNSKYHNSMQSWLQHVRADLLDWGFNTVGWVQELVTINPDNHRHSRNFTFEEYQWLNMPYCHLLPFAETHQWEIESRQPDFYSPGFEEWCDYVARDHCARMKDDPKLIGYFYVDCPMWVHTTPHNSWKGSLFDPEKLNDPAGKKELFDLANRYYQVTHTAIQRYDKNHLILGDRYEANALLPEQVIEAAKPYVDVFSFQCFGAPELIQDRMTHWANFTHRPVLVADSAQRRSHADSGWPPQTDRVNDPLAHGRVLDMLLSIPECVGFHLCGAYLKNRVRRSGLRDHQDLANLDIIAGMKEQHQRIQSWLSALPNAVNI